MWSPAFTFEAPSVVEPRRAMAYEVDSAPTEEGVDNLPCIPIRGHSTDHEEGRAKHHQEQELVHGAAVTAEGTRADLNRSADLFLTTSRS